MKIQLDKQQVQERSSQVGTGSTFISPNLIKETVTLDKDGNEVNWKTKQIIKRKEEQ